MKTVHTIDKVRAKVNEWKSQGYSVGFVPTMGFLHEGHQSLITRSVSENDKTVVSIFVNPMQFAPSEDLESYPRDLQADEKLCRDSGVDLIFNPTPEEMYPDGFCSYINMTGPSQGLCAKTRPIHFKGVCTVVGKLFNIVAPQRAYFGQKDAQQLAVIKRMVKDLGFPIEIVGCPIIREEDGLAKSSRNTYLNEQERQAALILSKTLKIAQDLIDRGVTDSEKLTKSLEENIKTEPLARIDYIEIVGADDMKPKDTVTSGTMIAMAVYIGKTRLIDNIII